MVNPVAHPNSYTCLLAAPLAPVIHIDTKQMLGEKCLVSLYKIKTPYIIRQANISSSKSISLSASIMQYISTCTMKGTDPIILQALNHHRPSAFNICLSLGASRSEWSIRGYSTKIHPNSNFGATRWKSTQIALLYLSGPSDSIIPQLNTDY